MNRELKRPYPDRRKLEAQCVSAVAFGNAANAGADVDVLDCPVWIICINVVAIEMLRAKLPPRKLKISSALFDRSARKEFKYDDRGSEFIECELLGEEQRFRSSCDIFRHRKLNFYFAQTLRAFYKKLFSRSSNRISSGPELENGKKDFQWIRK